MNKTELVETISQRTDLSKKDVQAVLSATRDLAGRHLTKNGSGEFTVPEVGNALSRGLDGVQIAVIGEYVGKHPVQCFDIQPLAVALCIQGYEIA